MDRATLEEFLDYDDWVWQQISIALSSHKVDVTTPAPGSGWPALRDCIGHMARAYDIWLSLLGRPFVGLDIASAASFAAIDEYRSKTTGQFREYLASLSDEQLHTDREVVRQGATMVYTPAELLGNVVAHERGHHGDVSTLLYQLGLAEEMPMIDYRFYISAKYGYS